MSQPNRKAWPAVLALTALTAGAFLLRRQAARPAWAAGQPERSAAFITGASSGIGAAFARALAERGFNLVLTARRSQRLAELSAELSSRYGVECTILTADLADPLELERLAAALQAMPAVVLLVNNAGFGTAGSFTAVEPQRHTAMVAIHNLAAVRLTHAALPAMLRRGAGAIINVSSIASFATIPGNSVYGASKHFLNRFSQTLALELRGSGVVVQALAPGYTFTEFHNRDEFAAYPLHRIPDFLWASADEVVRQSLAALGKGPVVFIPGLANRILALGASLPLAGPVVSFVLGRSRVSFQPSPEE